MNNQLKIDEEFKKLIPPLMIEEYSQLEENLKNEGCRDSLVIWNGILIDGHNRYEICTRNNITFSTKEMEFNNKEEVIEWIIRNQFGRRNLSNFQRSELALRLKPIIQAKAKERQRESMANARTYNPNNSKEQNVQKSAPTVKNRSRDELAKIAGVSHDTIEKVECIKRKGTEEQIQRARIGGNGNSVNAIYKEIKNDITKVCTKCGKEKHISEFYAKKGKCKTCINEIRQENSYFDIKGNKIKPSAEVEEKARLYSEQIEKDLYDETRNFDYTVEDMEEEIDSLINYFDRNVKDILNTRKSVIESIENKEKIKAVLGQAETAIKTIKEMFLYE